jgi:hypothetical protein
MDQMEPKPETTGDEGSVTETKAIIEGLKFLIFLKHSVFLPKYLTIRLSVWVQTSRVGSVFEILYQLFG